VNVESLIFQQIVDANFDQAIYTASPNNTINVVQIAAKGSGTNIGLALTPKGTGYISAQVPDGTSTGGNARGANAVDFHTKRAAANAVASGECSALIGGQQCIASGTNSVCVGGTANVASGVNAVCIGGTASNATGAGAVAISGGIASGVKSLVAGNGCQASGPSSVALGESNAASADGSAAFGRYSRASRLGMFAHASTLFVTNGDVQFFRQVLSNKTTTNAAVELALNGIFGGGSLVLIANTVLHAQVTILGVKSDGSAVAKYMRQVCIKRVVNTTSLVGSVETIGVDEAAGTSISITADDTAESLKITATGIASETWRWVAVVEGAELGIGT